MQTLTFVKEAKQTIEKIDQLLKTDISEDYKEFQWYMMNAEQLVKACGNPTIPTLDRLIDKIVETGWCDRKSLETSIGSEVL